MQPLAESRSIRNGLLEEGESERQCHLNDVAQPRSHSLDLSFLVSEFVPLDDEAIL